MKYRHFKKSRKLALMLDTPAYDRHSRHLWSKWGGAYLWRWRMEQWQRGKKEDQI